MKRVGIVVLIGIILVILLHVFRDGADEGRKYHLVAFDGGTFYTMTVTITTPPKLTEASLTTLRNHMAAQLKSTNLTIINAIPLE
jgi:hypothetical protein